MDDKLQYYQCIKCLRLIPTGNISISGNNIIPDVCNKCIVEYIKILIR